MKQPLTILILLLSMSTFAACGVDSQSPNLQQSSGFIIAIESSAATDSWFDGLESEIKSWSAINPPTNETSAHYDKQVVFIEAHLYHPIQAEVLRQRLQVNGKVLFVEPNYINSLDQSEPSSDYSGFSLTYDNFGQSSWINKINLVQAYRFLGEGTTTESPIIAVMDSGIDYLHPALADQIWQNPGLTTSCENDRYGCDTTSAAPGQLGDGDVYPIGTDGPNETCDSRFFNDVNPTNCVHGTHAAGVIAALPYFGYGGICPTCKILPIRIMSPDASSEGILDSSIIRGLHYIKQLIKKGVNIRIINASFGKFQQSTAVAMLIDELATMGKGALMIAAAGNENSSEPQYPAALSSVIGVANVDPFYGTRHYTSNFGRWVDISAPGTGNDQCFNSLQSRGIKSAAPGRQYKCAEGTSISAPVVSGVAGLILTKQPHLSATQVKNALLSSANRQIYQLANNDDFTVQEVDGYSIPQLGAGMVDAAAALTSQQGPEFKRAPRRVQGGCGSIGLAAGGQTSTWICLLLPILVVFLRRKNG